MTAPLAALALAALNGAQPALQTLPMPQVQANDVASALRLYVAFRRANARPEYTVDCQSGRIDVAAAALGSYGDTAELYRALKRASSDLAAISRKYASPAMPPVVLRSAALTTTRPIRPVAPGNLAAANAAAVLDEAELTLVRSSTRAPDGPAFQQVAEVIGSAKVLLRAS